MSGLVQSVAIRKDDVVFDGLCVCVIEAMKAQNPQVAADLCQDKGRLRPGGGAI